MNVANHARTKKTIQLALRDLAYAQWLRSLLQHDGQHRVRIVDKPDLRLAAIVVVDQDNFENEAHLTPTLPREK